MNTQFNVNDDDSMNRALDECPNEFTRRKSDDRLLFRGRALPIPVVRLLWDEKFRKVHDRLYPESPMAPPDC